MISRQIMLNVQRVAETLDVEVKRWSSGKEGNLRALLSTLQYVWSSHAFVFVYDLNTK